MAANFYPKSITQRLNLTLAQVDMLERQARICTCPEMGKFLQGMLARAQDRLFFIQEKIADYMSDIGP